MIQRYFQENSFDWSSDFIRKSREYRETVSETDILIRTSLTALESILQSGVFKTIHDGVLSPTPSTSEERDKIEKSLFVSSHPVYGYLGYKSGEDKQTFVECYGDVRIALSHSVKQRSTFIGGDSLEERCVIPSLYFQASLVGQPRSIYSQRSFSEIWDTAAMYHEVQIHRGLTSDEIDEITFLGKEPSSSLTALLKKHRIERCEIKDGYFKRSKTA